MISTFTFPSFQPLLFMTIPSLGPFPFGKSIAAFLAGMAAVLASASGVYAQGWNPDLRALDSDKRVDVVPAPPTFGGSGYDNLPSKVSLRDHCPKPMDQGGIESCMGWALGYGLLTVLLNKKDTPFSPNYVYRWALQIKSNREMDRWPNQGVDFQHGFLALTTQGSCKFGRPEVKVNKDKDKNELTFDPISSELVKEGNANRQFFAPWRLAQDNIVYAMKKALSEGRPLPCGFRVYSGLRSGQGLTPIPGHAKPCLWKTQPQPWSQMLHAMLVVGYDDDLGAFEIMNSYGSDFADDGFFWISYDLIADLGNDKTLRGDNPCLLVAWDYTYSPLIDSFDPQGDFAAGKISGWVRLADVKGETNFEVSRSDAPILSSLKKDDAVTVTQAVIVRETFNATGKAATTSAPAIQKLSVGDEVVVEDLNILSSEGGRKSEYWIKVRAPDNSFD